ncbi:MAG: cyclically-permuted mutarotase family protein [Phocaeicola sp.]|uniref:cyclically-permuted mutarotase family protein n=1 Tax=Phocaeicola TaxID=909656 RepID=UPI00234E553F|nr:cyclically-permuted mutarotase family protein [Phocaeicola oris]MCE2617372.1 cyclically-permuted mutarotase family protein [Phocaeicola oris]
MKIIHTKLPTTGLTGNLAKGVSASYAALLNGNLIVAGGANFPDKLGFEGGKKAFYDEILIFDQEAKEWKIIGKLPQASAYGVSVPLSSEAALWIGGNTPSESLSEVYKVSLIENKTIKLDSFPQLPATMDNFAGCSINNKVFVAGAKANGEEGNFFYATDTQKDSTWTRLPDYPGIPRTQPVMTALKIEGREYIYLLGGFFGGNDMLKPQMATEVIRYSVADNEWEKVAEQTDPETKELFSLGGATAMPVDNRYILYIGGVNHHVFLDAITSQYDIVNDSTTTEEQKKELNHNFSKNYMTQPIEYYKFNSEYRAFDTQTNTWLTIDNVSNGARAGATLVFEGKTFFAIQGELKPGVRSSETWKGEIE